MIDFTKEGRIGDKVKSLRCGKGTIVAIGNCENESYPIVVAHGSGGQSSYTATGKYLEIYSHSSLMFDNGSVTIDQGSPPERESVDRTGVDWDRVRQGNFLIGVSDISADEARKSPETTQLYSYKPEHDKPFETDGWRSHRYASIPDETGIRKPHFGGEGPTDKPCHIAYQIREGSWRIARDPKGWKWTGGDEDIMEYVELV